MARSRAALRVLSAAALASALGHAAPAGAQIVGHPVEVSAGAGLFSPDARASVKSGPVYRGSIGYRFLPGFTLEGQATFAPSEADTAPHQAHNFSMGGVDLRWNLRPADSKVLPFAIVGAGYALSHTTGTKPDKLERGAATFGLGLLLNALDPRCYVRIEARDIMFREREQPSFSHDLGVTAGLQWAFFGRVRDQDLDKVRDWIDRCPDTPIGSVVDAHGCPVDPDGDKVPDGIDKCAGTPAGCTVDKKGCPADADGDGVCDGVDKCPATPAGATVDLAGCPADPDSDAVYDGVDQCANTPRGCTVDAKGCPADADGDGVCDGVDVCPNTPRGSRVDAHGCPADRSPLEVELLDTGKIRVENFQFDRRKGGIQPQSLAAVEEAGRVLQQYPQLRVEVGGHADNRGSKTMNDTLSESRARAVLDHLKAAIPALPADQYTVKGYGFSKPVAPNTTDAGRSRNRRIEFRVLNPGALRAERDKRRSVRGVTPAPAPADTTRR